MFVRCDANTDLVAVNMISTRWMDLCNALIQWQVLSTLSNEWQLSLLCTFQNLYLLCSNFCIVFYFKKFVCLFSERGEGKERGRETSMCGFLSRAPYWEPGPNPGMCPDWELNQQPFGSQDGTQSTEPHQPGPQIVKWSYKKTKYISSPNCTL